jgi:hypothetical protein
MHIVVKSSILCLCIIGLFMNFSCSKKTEGICYCSYYAGNKTQWDLRTLSRSQQIDSCYELDRLAEPFAGDCSLK